MGPECDGEVECPVPHEGSESGLTFFMNILEKEIEDIVYYTSVQKLSKRGLDLYDSRVRQVALGPYGIADMVCYRKTDKKYDIQVVEIKKEAVSESALFQAVRYSKAVLHIIGEENINSLSIILIGKYIDRSGPICYAPDIFHNLKIFTYSISIDLGILFYQEGGLGLCIGDNSGLTADTILSPRVPF